MAQGCDINFSLKEKISDILEIFKRNIKKTQLNPKDHNKFTSLTLTHSWIYLISNEMQKLGIESRLRGFCGRFFIFFI